MSFILRYIFQYNFNLLYNLEVINQLWLRRNSVYCVTSVTRHIGYPVNRVETHLFQSRHQRRVLHVLRVLYKRETLSVVMLELSEIMDTYNTVDDQ